MSNWASATGEPALWVVNTHPGDPWFTYFDALSQFAISRSAQKFKNPSSSWIFSGTQYFPSPMILFTDYSSADVEAAKKIWLSLGSPKTFIYSSPDDVFYKKLSATQPDLFTHIHELP